MIVNEENASFQVHGRTHNNDMVDCMMARTMLREGRGVGGCDHREPLGSVPMAPAMFQESA